MQREVASAIFGYIIKNNLRPGERLTERMLANRLGLSRSPVRAALSVLSQEGIIEIRPGDGWFVRKLPSKQVERRFTTASDQDELIERMLKDRFLRVTGVYFSESEFIARYGISRGILRKILIKLSQEGLVERSRGNGWRFSPILSSRNTQLASYEFRLAIEPAAIMAEGFAIEPEILDRCRTEHEQFLAEKIAGVSVARLFELNAEFHGMLAEFSHNEFFMQGIATHNRLRRIVEYSTSDDQQRMLRSCQEHLSIIEAIERGERHWAATLMERHLKTARDRLVNLFSSDSSPD